MDSCLGAFWKLRKIRSDLESSNMNFCQGDKKQVHIGKSCNWERTAKNFRYRDERCYMAKSCSHKEIGIDLVISLIERLRLSFDPY